MCFNFRGVGRSEGAVCCVDDLVTDVRACVDFLLSRGVAPHHLLLHGFSLGGAIAALFLGADPDRRHFHDGKLARYQMGPPSLLLSAADVPGA